MEIPCTSSSSKKIKYLSLSFYKFFSLFNCIIASDLYRNSYVSKEEQTPVNHKNDIEDEVRVHHYFNLGRYFSGLWHVWLFRFLQSSPWFTWIEWLLASYVVLQKLKAENLAEVNRLKFMLVCLWVINCTIICWLFFKFSHVIALVHCCCLFLASEGIRTRSIEAADWERKGTHLYAWITISQFYEHILYFNWKTLPLI